MERGYLQEEEFLITFAVPYKIFMGFDASGDRRVEFTNGSDRYFTIAAVTCSNFAEAERVARWLDRRWPNKKGKNLHPWWQEIVEELRCADLRFYVLLVDKRVFSGKIDRANYNKIPFTEAEFDEKTDTSDYTAINDEYAKHGWLVVNELGRQGYHGPTEIRWDSDLDGYGWELSKKKVKDHAENSFGQGLCDLQDSGQEYPLVRIADIVANFSHWQMKKQKAIGAEPPVIGLLRPNVCIMIFDEEDIDRLFRMRIIQDPGFCAW